ncbi:MAG: 2Fe-2S iron-sulfur cluster binding domain-containing protein [Scytolyngbya sp. HA4215-MV1]|nr:2Fe-2S iron-sulfur cluster binding domain-containing protein [Scytolyngbya sp. HA4215-MV1]
MLASLVSIKNPLARSLTAAVTIGSAITLTAAIVLGATNAKDESAYKTAIYTTLAGTGFGALLGLVYQGQANQSASAKPLTDQSSAPMVEGSGWQDWRNFVVVRKVKESEEITSFYLKPVDGGAIPKFQPGQFLTIKLEIPGQPRPIIRTYSLSDYPDPCDYYRLSIKRESAPKELDVPPGIASNFMHDQVQEGTVIPAKSPSGKFVLDLQKTLPAVLISNGVGITPMMSMAKAATQLKLDRPIWFVHGARDGRFHAFREEVSAIAQQNSNLNLHFVYSRPRPEDEGHYHSTGYADTALIQTLVQQEAEYFLCGSPPFMQSLREGLQAAGVPTSRIFFEAFSKGKPAPTTTQSTTARDNDKIGGAEVVFAQSGKTFTWDASADSILEFAEANDLEPPYSCRQGICGTCMCKISEGEVEYQTTPVATIDNGSALICISKPKTARVVLEL